VAAIGQTAGKLKSCPLGTSPGHVRGEDSEVPPIDFQFPCHR
jgi:hypothetical protein